MTGTTRHQLKLRRRRGAARQRRAYKWDLLQDSLEIESSDTSIVKLSQKLILKIGPLNNADEIFLCFGKFAVELLHDPIVGIGLDQSPKQVGWRKEWDFLSIGLPQEVPWAICFGGKIEVLFALHCLLKVLSYQSKSKTTRRLETVDEGMICCGWKGCGYDWGGVGNEKMQVVNGKVKKV